LGVLHDSKNFQHSNLRLNGEWHLGGDYRLQKVNDLCHFTHLDPLKKVQERAEWVDHIADDIAESQLATA